MKGRAVTLLVAMLGATVFLNADQRGDKKQEEPQEPFDVFISDAREDAEGEESLSAAVEEVRKAFEKEEKLYRLVENPLLADIQIEITSEGKIEDLDTKIISRGMPTPTPGARPSFTPPDRSKRSGTYFIECVYAILKKFRLTRIVQGDSSEKAAEALPRALKVICETYCR